MARILFTAADINELNCATEAVNSYKAKVDSSGISIKNIFSVFNFEFLLTGIGTTSTCYKLTKAILEAKAENNPYTHIINIGIAGSFNLDKFSIGSLAIINKEYFGDLGFESKENGFQSLFEYGMYDKDMPPFTSGALERSKLDSSLEEFLSIYFNTNSSNYNIGGGIGITVQKIITDNTKIEAIREKFSADIESMEGAAIYYVCLQEGIPTFEIRAISNKVGVRDKSEWNISLALRNLSLFCTDLVEHITSTYNVTTNLWGVLFSALYIFELRF